MSRIIKDLNSFSNETNLNEDFSLGNIISSALTFGGEGLRKTVKEKIAAIILEKVGISQDSVLSGIVQQIVDAIPFKDYPAILSGERANVEYLAPKMVQALSEFIQKKGFDTIAEKLGIESKGLLYNTIVNGIQSPEGKEKLQKMFIEIFGGENATGSVFRDAISGLPKQEKEKLTSGIRQKISSSYEPKSGGNNYLNNFWSSMMA